MDNKALNSVVIKGWGRYLPEKRLTNNELAQRVDTSDEWIRTRTGIRERRIAQAHETSATMGIAAAKEALKNAGIQAKAVDLLIVATMSGDMPTPSTACWIQKELKTQGAAFDILAACSGFVYAMDVATQMLKTGAYKNALIIGTEKLSSLVDWEDRSTCVLFGDAAAAAVLGTVSTPNVGVICTELGADGQGAEVFEIPAGGCRTPTSSATVAQKGHCIKMNGPELFKSVVSLLEEGTLAFLKKHNLELDAIDWIIPHQANVRILESVCRRIGFPMQRVCVNLDRYGNTSAATIPLAFMEAIEDKRIQPGQILLLMAFGAGLTWGYSIIKHV